MNRLKKKVDKAFEEAAISSVGGIALGLGRAMALGLGKEKA
jgi:hypothetical protein